MAFDMRELGSLIGYVPNYLRRNITDRMERMEDVRKQAGEVGPSIGQGMLDFAAGFTGEPRRGVQANVAVPETMRQRPFNAMPPPAVKPSQAAPVAQKKVEAPDYYPQGNNPDESNLRFGAPAPAPTLAPAPVPALAPAPAPVVTLGAVPQGQLTGVGTIENKTNLRDMYERMLSRERMDELVRDANRAPTLSSNPTFGDILKYRSEQKNLANRINTGFQRQQAESAASAAEQEGALKARELGLKDVQGIRDVMAKLGAAGMGLEGTKYTADIEAAVRRYVAEKGLEGEEKRLSGTLAAAAAKSRGNVDPLKAAQALKIGQGLELTQRMLRQADELSRTNPKQAQLMYQQAQSYLLQNPGMLPYLLEAMGQKAESSE